MREVGQQRPTGRRSRRVQGGLPRRALRALQLGRLVPCLRGADVYVLQVAPRIVLRVQAPLPGQVAQSVLAVGSEAHGGSVAPRAVRPARKPELEVGAIVPQLEIARRLHAPADPVVLGHRGPVRLGVPEVDLLRGRVVGPCSDLLALVASVPPRIGQDVIAVDDGVHVHDTPSGNSRVVSLRDIDGLAGHERVLDAPGSGDGQEGERHASPCHRGGPCCA
mmetsp:Transcript_58534/g.131656  ORF Transcript_58534/g.131656 Transcript_58534/m.131656 type:complete len:221 (+) Transcript_58534:84-746(+)